MKQSEIDRELRLLVKAQAKQCGWNSVGGSAYWTLGPLFFQLVPSVNAKQASFACTVRFKWLELDRLLWRVLGMSSNEKEPFSLHANGAFVLTGQEILRCSTSGLCWRPGVLAEAVESAMRQARERANEVASCIASIESYLDFVEREHAAFLQRHPGAVTNVWKEALLVAMQRGDLERAAEIARARIAAGDSGGFSSEGRTFFERAEALCRE